ncbi:MAG: hypothetical protein WBA01_01515, partial [Phormidesmis sp.]
MKQFFCCSLAGWLLLCIALSAARSAAAQAAEPPNNDPANDPAIADSISLPPEVIEQSPVLQRWLQSVPNVQSDIRNDPSFTTRIQAGYTFFPSSDSTGGFIVGVDDVFFGEMPLTLSADYQQNFRGDRTAYG